MDCENNILITGFGLFGSYKVNPSWEAVKLLTNYKLPGYNIITMEVPVTYRFVDENTHQLWSKYKPRLVIHVGVSSRNGITLEDCANRLGYVKVDSNNCYHPTKQVCEAGQDCIRTGINVESICASLTKRNFKISPSKDAGRFLCEYLYYKSLQMDPKRTLFVHVPPLNEPYSAEELAQCLQMIIDEALQQINC